MNSGPLIICYPSNAGEVNIRTVCNDDNILTSLEDVVQVLAIENTEFEKKHGKQGLGKLIQAAKESLDEDEREYIDIKDTLYNVFC